MGGLFFCFLPVTFYYAHDGISPLFSEKILPSDLQHRKAFPRSLDVLKVYVYRKDPLIIAQNTFYLP